ncbi:MAG: sensor histidine kinase, partial [Actinomycetota bacterium]
LNLLVRQLKQSAGLEARLEVEEEAKRLPPALETCLYRVAQEAMANTVKHAGASVLEIRIHIDEGTARLSVEDDGEGFKGADAGAGDCTPRESFGLYGMRERVRGLGGTLCIESGQGMGTRVTAEFPISSRNEA